MTRPSQLQPAELNEAQARIYNAILETRGSIVGPFGIWLHSPEMADRAQSLGEFVRYRTSLEPRLSELAILVTARIWDCQVEWSLHEPFAVESGLSEDIIDAIRHGQDPHFGLDDEQARCLQLCQSNYSTIDSFRTTFSTRLRKPWERPVSWS